MPTAEKLNDLRMSWRPTPEKVDRVVRTAIEVVRPSRDLHLWFLGTR